MGDSNGRHKGKKNLRFKKRKAGTHPGFSVPCLHKSAAARLYFTASFSCLPALNFGTLDAAIRRGAPVCGFLPIRAFLLTTEKVPNPTKLTFRPLFRELVTPSKKALTALLAWALVTFASLAILLTRSSLVIYSPPSRLLEVQRLLFLCQHVEDTIFSRVCQELFLFFSKKMAQPCLFAKVNQNLWRENFSA